jgi:hypothetical protein
MLDNLINLLGLKNEMDEDFKKMLDFPKTLCAIDCIALFILLLNDLTNYIQFNKTLNFALYALVFAIFACAGVLLLKIKSDFKNIIYDINVKINEEYSNFFEQAKKGNFYDINIELDECKISRILDFKPAQQEITKEMIKEFMSLIFSNKKDDIDKVKYPVENWDLYQIYGLEKAYVTFNKATLYMSAKLPEDGLNDEEDFLVLSMYLNAMETLLKQNQIIRGEKQEVKEVIQEERKHTDYNIYNGVKRGIVETEEDEIRKILETNDKLKGKDLKKIEEVLRKMQEDKE